MTLAIGLAVSGCGDDEEESGPCDPVEGIGCKDGKVCEVVEGGEPACFAPVVVHGRVIDLADESGVAGARIVALDINGAAQSSVALSDDDGSYALAVPTERDADGNPLDEAVTLEVTAPGYAAFPEPPRQALPIELGEATARENELVIENSATTIGLIALDSSAGTGRIAGRIDHEDAAGALVVAVVGERAVSRASADADGAFTLFNVPEGTVSVEGYRAGLNVEPESVELEDGGAADEVVLSASTEGLVKVTGSVNIVNAAGGLTTSVILALESTFIESVKRGLAPQGLRAADVSGAFEIEGVAPGKYVVLAAFENDELVRDPDEGIAGTQIVHLEIDGSEPEAALEQSFKVTGALAVREPDSDDATLPVLDANSDPTFVWADDSSEDGYEIRIYDAFGELVHENTELPGVSGSADVSYTWAGAELENGMIYQMRAYSFREGRSGAGGRSFISTTEDLRGAFLAGSPEADAPDAGQ